MRHEGAGRGAAVERLEDRRLHLEEAPLVEEPTQVRDRSGADLEDPADLGMHREVRVALPVALLRIGERGVGRGAVVPHVALAAGERPERLGEQLERLHPDGDLAHLGAEQPSPHPDVIVEVEQLHQLVALTQRVPPEVDLDAPGDVLEMGERGLPLRAEGGDAPRHPDLGAGLAHPVVPGREGLGGGVAPVEAIRERRYAELLQLGALLPPRRLDVAALLGGAHAALPPNRLR